MDVEEALLGTMDSEELELEVKKKIESFHGFLTRDIALKLIAKEKGLLKEKEKVYRIADIPKDARKIALRASIKRIWPIARYASGKSSRVMELRDESGAMPLVLWNDDIEHTKGIHPRDEISVSGAYERNGELHLSYNGGLDITKKAPFPKFDELEEGQLAHIRGTVSSIEGVDSFVSGTDAKPAFSFLITDGMSKRRCILWGNIEKGKKLAEGDEVLIEDALINNDNIEVSADTRVLVRRPRDMVIGTVNRLECHGEKLFADVGGREISLDRENALRFMGVDAAEDIELSTIVALKKDNLLNNGIALKIEEKNGQIFIRG